MAVAVKLIVGLLSPAGDAATFGWARGRIAEAFGAIEREYGPYPFDYTDYYREISRCLERRFFSFTELRHPFGLVAWKKRAVEMEAESAGAAGAGRRVNVDPGYVDGARLVLASTKDNAHRVYLYDDIYAEVTLCRRKTGWERFSYTFPDFASGIYDGFLDAVRADWRADIRKQRGERCVDREVQHRRHASDLVG